MARHAAHEQVSSAEMANDVQLVIRIPQEMADRIKAYAEQLSRDVGVGISVAAATRKLLGEALDATDKPSAGRGKR